MKKIILLETRMREDGDRNAKAKVVFHIVDNRLVQIINNK